MKHRLKKNTKINETKTWFFEKITKIENLQPDTLKKREQAQMNKIKNETGDRHYN